MTPLNMDSQFTLAAQSRDYEALHTTEDRIPLASIDGGDAPLDPGLVAALAKSIDCIGLRYPIYLQIAAPQALFPYGVVDGRHRFAAMMQNAERARAALDAAGPDALAEAQRDYSRFCRIPAFILGHVEGSEPLRKLAAFDMNWCRKGMA